MMFGSIMPPVSISTCPLIAKLTLGFSTSETVDVDKTVIYYISMKIEVALTA